MQIPEDQINMKAVCSSQPNIRYGAVIVAAGMSTRMKQFKQMMRIGDMSLAERVIVNFRNAGVENIVMVTGFNADSLEKSLKKFDVHFIRNAEYETTDMFASVKIGMKYIQGKCDRVFFCPVDVPFFMDTTVEKEKRLSDKVIVPTCDGRDGHPLLISASVIPHILAYSGERGLKGAYESLPDGYVRRIRVDDEGAVTDADTQDDFAKLVDIHNNRLLHSEVELQFVSTTPFFGREMYELLRHIESEGNVREACEKVGISYSKAWSLIRECEGKFGSAIVERQQGGAFGGAAQVTERGRLLLKAYRELSDELSEFGEKHFREKMKKYDLIQDV